MGAKSITVVALGLLVAGGVAYLVSSAGSAPEVAKTAKTEPPARTQPERAKSLSRAERALREMARQGQEAVAAKPSEETAAHDPPEAVPKLIPGTDEGAPDSPLEDLRRANLQHAPQFESEADMIATMDAIHEAGVAYDRGNYAGAIQLAEKALAKDPKNTRMLSLASISSCILGKADEARAYYQRLYTEVDKQRVEQSCAMHDVEL